MDIDLNQAIDNYCPICKAKKEKYIGKIMGSPAVLYRPTCSCEKPIEIKRIGKSNKQLFDSLQIPFWRLTGQPPKPKDIAYEKYLKSRNMTYGDAVRERDYLHRASEKSALPEFQKRT